MSNAFNRGRASFAGIAALILAFSSTITMAEDVPVVSNLEAYVVATSADGTESFAPAGHVDPGDVIEYRVAHKNASGSALSGFVVNGRIPDGTVYVVGSAQGEQAGVLEVSVEGEPWQPWPAFKTIVDENGEKIRVPAEAADVASLRWRLGETLEDGGASANVYRVQVRP